MKGSPGPYGNESGDVWVPRTVPYLEARKVARQWGFIEYGDRLQYIGKDDAQLLGFTRDCPCDGVCGEANRCRSCDMAEYWCECAEPDLTDWDVCRVPAWHFRFVEPGA